MALAVEILSLLGEKPRGKQTPRDVLRRGLPPTVVSRLALLFGSPRGVIETLVGIPKSTANRRARAAKPLSLEHSDRAYRLASAFERAADVLGSGESAQRWFKEPNRTLDGATPLALLDTQPGTDRVMRVLAQIEHGVY